MTAGSAATFQAQPNAEPSHSTDPSLTFQPRRLSRGERSRGLTHVYWSPRNRRIVTLSDSVSAALAMQLEFDYTLACYVERPRQLELTPRQSIDISFWTRSKNGEERFWLAVPDGGAPGTGTGHFAVRDPQLLAAAATRAGISLHIVSESQLRSQMAGLKAFNELLLHVWEYARQPVRSVIRRHIEDRLRNSPRVSLSSLVRGLDFTEGAIKSVVAAMVHDGSARLADYSPGLVDAVLEAPNA